MSILGGIAGNLAGGSIGHAVVSLVLDTTGYNAQLEKTKVQTAAATGTMGKSTSMFAGAATAAYAIAATAAVAFLKSAVDAAAEHEQVIAALTAQVGSNTQAYEAQAAALQKVSGFSDEAILSADTILARYKLTEAQVRTLIPTVLDYARVSGKTVPDAAGQIGKALLGNTRALKAIGISYTSTGNAAEDYANIQQLVSEKLSGQAAAYAETYQGKLEIVSQRFQEIQESIGNYALPALKDFTDLLIETSNMIDLVKEQLPAIGPALDAAFSFPGLTLIEHGVENLSQLLGVSADNTDGLTQATDELNGSFGDAIASTNNYRTAQEELAHETEKATRAIQEQRLAQLQAAGGLLGLVSSLQSANDAQRELHTLQRQGKQGTAEYRAAVIDATQAQLEFRTEVRQYIADNPNRSLSATRQALREMGTQAGITGRDFRDALGGPLKEILRDLDALRDKRVTIQLDTSQVTYAGLKIDQLQQKLNRVGI